MSVKDFKVKIISDETAYEFLKKYHYLRDFIPTNFDIAYGLYNGNSLIGAMVFDWWDYEYCIDHFNLTFSHALIIRDSLRLRFLACVDDTPKNTESYFIGHVLRRLKQDMPNADVIVSFSGGGGNHPNHKGVIYKASNFTLMFKGLIKDEDDILRDFYLYTYRLR